MASATTEKRALSMLKTFELAGRTVSRVTIDGRKIEFVFEKSEDADEFDRIDMRHGKA